MTPPIAAWLFAYRRGALSADVLGGMTAAAIVIPNAMAYAVIGGLHVEAGLYTALAAMIVYPLLGSSRPLSVTTTSAIAMLTATAVAAESASNGASPLAVAGTLAVLAGAALILARVFRLGFLANFISTPVLVGFQAGVGAVILIGQLGAVLGVEVTRKSPLGTLLELPKLVAHAHLPTVLVAASGLVVLLGLPRLVSRVPAPLVWVAHSIAASVVLHLGARGVLLVGAGPSGLPRIAAPDLALAVDLWPAALGIALMSFTEGVAAARAFRAHDDPPIEANDELLAVGAANVAAAFVGGMPAGGGTSQTSVANSAGVRSQLAQWVTAAVALMTIFLFSRMIGLLPKAALAALVVFAAASMIKPKTFRAIARVRRRELSWAFVTVIGVVSIGTLNGILVAVAISMLTLLYLANHPHVYALAYCRDKGVFRPAGAHDGDETFAGLLMVRVEGRLTFANAANAAEKIHALVIEADPEVIIFDCSAIPDIEYTALVMLTDAEASLRARGVSLCLAAMTPEVLAVVERTPLGAALGHERMFFTLRKAFDAWQQRGRDRPSAPRLRREECKDPSERKEGNEGTPEGRASA